MSSEDLLFSWGCIGYAAVSSLSLRSGFWLGNNAPRRSAKCAHLRCVWWRDEFCGVQTFHVRFYCFDTLFAVERVSCLELFGAFIRLSAY